MPNPDIVLPDSLSASVIWITHCTPREMIASRSSNDGVRSCPPYSTTSTANTVAPASPKCGNNFFWSRLRATRCQRMAMSAVPATPLVGIAALTTIGQLHSTKLSTFTEPARRSIAMKRHCQLGRSVPKSAASENQGLALPSLAVSATEASVVSRRKVNVS